MKSEISAAYFPKKSVFKQVVLAGAAGLLLAGPDMRIFYQATLENFRGAGSLFAFFFLLELAVLLAVLVRIGARFFMGTPFYLYRLPSVVNRRDPLTTLKGVWRVEGREALLFAGKTAAAAVILLTLIFRVLGQAPEPLLFSAYSFWAGPLYRSILGEIVFRFFLVSLVWTLLEQRRLGRWLSLRVGSVRLSVSAAAVLYFLVLLLLERGRCDTPFAQLLWCAARCGPPVVWSGILYAQRGLAAAVIFHAAYSVSFNLFFAPAGLLILQLLPW